MPRFQVDNQAKILFPEAGISKGGLIDYYRRIAPLMLPLVRDRPVTMERHPDGIGGKSFFQKDIPDHFPDWIERVTVAKEGGTVTHLLCNDADTLAYIASQGCITPHVWLSSRDHPRQPDQIIFDLDPPAADPPAARGAARTLRRELRRLGLRSVVKTTGSKGFHIMVPIVVQWEFDVIRRVARAIAKRVARSDPDRLTVEQRKAKRGDRVYIDTFRNGYAQTVVAPYAVRARPGAPIATPVQWSELDRDLAPDRYAIGNIFRRLGQKKDVWPPLERLRQKIVPSQLLQD